MIINREKWSETLKKKVWLVYLLSPCEQGAEGWSGWEYHSVAFGDTDEEIYSNWVENVKQIYGVDFSGDLKYKDGYWSCYYPIYKCEIPTTIYGHSQPISIEKHYKEHDVDFITKKCIHYYEL